MVLSLYLHEINDIFLEQIDEYVIHFLLHFFVNKIDSFDRDIQLRLMKVYDVFDQKPKCLSMTLFYIHSIVFFYCYFYDNSFRPPE